MKKLLVSLLAAMHVVTTKSTVTVLIGVTMLALLLMARSVKWSPPPQMRSSPDCPRQNIWSPLGPSTAL